MLRARVAIYNKLTRGCAMCVTQTVHGDRGVVHPDRRLMRSIVMRPKTDSVLFHPYYMFDFERISQQKNNLNNVCLMDVGGEEVPPFACALDSIIKALYIIHSPIYPNRGST